jgi:predicted alpha/beta superfamily hydrolase
MFGVTVVLLAGFLNTVVSSQNVCLERTQNHIFKAKNVDQEYQIQVYLPPGYADRTKTFPVLYVLDADKSFGMSVNIMEWLSWAREIPDMIAVGIAYGGSTQNWWDKRSRDYTPWKDSQKTWGEWPLAGGAGNFLKFLQEELIPWVESNYRTAGNDRGLAGLSLGGLFGAYVIFVEPRLFSKYLLSGAALIWDNRHIFKIEEEFAEGHGSLAAKVYAAVGEFDDQRIIGPYQDFLTLLKRRNYEGLEIKGEVIPGETHISSWPASLTRGLKYLYGK